MKTILQTLPKVELHLHLDGSVRIKTVAEILDIEEKEAFRQMVCDENTDSLTAYLTKFELPLKVMQTKENLKRITKELLEDLKKEHVIYVELRFAPILHTKEGLTQKEVVESVIEGIKNVEEITCNLILCCMRHCELKENLETLHVANMFYQKGVVAIDLAGDESKYPTHLFQELFKQAQDLRVPYTIHAGEASDYHSIEEALEFKASRIGHGIAAIQNERLIERIQKQKILLEICPQSNLDTKIVHNKKEHPLKELFKHCMISINTDNRTVSNVTLTKEYEDAISLFDFTLDDLLTCNLNAISCAFIEETQKERFKKQLKEEYYDTTH